MFSEHGIRPAFFVTGRMVPKIASLDFAYLPKKRFVEVYGQATSRYLVLKRLNNKKGEKEFNENVT